MKLELLYIESLRFTKKKRRGISPRRVEELRMELESGADMTPIRVHALGDGTYVVKDGRHRIQAHLEAGISCIAAIVEDLISRIRSIWREMRTYTLRGVFLYLKTKFPSKEKQRLVGAVSGKDKRFLVWVPIDTTKSEEVFVSTSPCITFAERVRTTHPLKHVDLSPLDIQAVGKLLDRADFPASHVLSKKQRYRQFVFEATESECSMLGKILE